MGMPRWWKDLMRLGALLRLVNRAPDEIRRMTQRCHCPSCIASPRGAGNARAFLLAALVAPATALAAGADGWIDDAARDLLAGADALRPLLLGELHGTRETPAVLVSMLRQSGDTPWLLGLEIPRQEQARVDAFLRSDGGAKARAALVAGPFWTRDLQDGRSSDAMMRLIDGVRALRRGGRDIRIVCFDDAAPLSDGRDAHMADALRAALVAQKHRRAVALTGNYHARIGRGSPWNAEKEFMGWHLRDLSPLSVDVTAPTGANWICTPECGEHAFGRERVPGKLALHVASQADERGYHGSLALPQFTASPPAAKPSSATNEPSASP